MRKQRSSAIAGGVAILILAFVFICFCKLGSSEMLKEKYKAEETDEEIEKIEDKTQIMTLAQRGYTVYQPLSECIQKLIDTKIFYPTDENRYTEYEGWTEQELEEQKEIDMTDYETALEKLKEIGTAKYLERSDRRTVSDDQFYVLNGVLKFDGKTGHFTDDKIAQIEACGFPGFAGLMKQVEEGVADEKNWLYENGGTGEPMSCFEIYYPGVTFYLNQFHTGNFYIYMSVNCSAFYIPEKYRSVIDGVTADGNYFLYSSCVGGDKDILVFCRNASICHRGYSQTHTKTDKYDEKKLAFIFEDGKLTDYSCMISRAELNLDEADQKVLDAYASGTGKKLPKKGISRDGKLIYKAD